MLLKKGTKNFQNSPTFEWSLWFYVKISGNFESFQYFNLKTVFLENETFSQNTRIPLFSWKHLDWKCIISLQEAISKANVKTNRMMSTKWTYHKERGFVRNYFIFLKILFQFKNLL